MRKILNHRLPFYVTLIASFIMATCAIILFRQFIWKTDSTQVMSAPTSIKNATVEIKRLGGYNFIAPLMFVDKPDKSDRFTALTQDIAAYINAKKQSGDVVDASYYIKELDALDWSGINENEKYFAGSLLKIPILISYLRLEEKAPGVLEKKLTLETPLSIALSPEILSKKIEVGHAYTVKELLRYMIAYSDNNAAALLDMNLDQTVFNKVLTDLGMSMPEKEAKQYPISAKEVSLFIRAIYNAAYLTIPHSEYAAELLSTSDFKDGLVKGFPPSVKIIHKFGESGNQLEHHFSETGIVFLNNKVYAIAVMTKGKDLAKLPSVIADIAQKIYQQVIQ